MREKKVCFSIYYILSFFFQIARQYSGEGGRGAWKLLDAPNSKWKTMDPLITEFMKCSDRSLLHDGEAPQANMLREHSGYDNSRILYVIVMHCLKYFTTCTVFAVVLVILVYLTRLVTKSVHYDVMICSGTLRITDHFLIEAPHFGVSVYFSRCRRELVSRFCYWATCYGVEGLIFLFFVLVHLKEIFSSRFRNFIPVNGSVLDYHFVAQNACPYVILSVFCTDFGQPLPVFRNLKWLLWTNVKGKFWSFVFSLFVGTKNVFLVKEVDKSPCN